MKKTDENYWSMEKGVIAYLDQNKEKWNAVAPISKTFEELKENAQQIRQAATTQVAGDTTGHTRQKDLLFDTMTDRALKIADKMAAFAMVERDLILQKSTSYSISSLQSGTEQEVVSRCEVIAELGNKKLGQMKDYNLTQEMLDQLQETIDAYKAILGDREVTATGRINASQNIPELIKQARIIFKRLDKMVTGVYDGEDDFENRYFIERHIKNRHGGRANGNGEEEGEE